MVECLAGRHDSPERKEVADFLLRSLSRDVLDADGSRHGVSIVKLLVVEWRWY